MGSMLIAEKIIKRLYNFAKKEDYELWITGSMSQEYIKWEDDGAEITIKDIKKLTKKLNLNNKSMQEGLAMHPDICLMNDSMETKNKIKRLLLNLKDSEGQNILKERYESLKEINLKAIKSKALEKNK